jgi:hypothetical protein
MHERDKLAEERQQLSDDLSKLQKNIRDTAREMAPSQPGVAQKLRDALTEMDESDLDNHVQRTADWLRSGINPNSNGTEGEIAQGLAKLDQQLQQAGNGMGQSKPGQRETGQGDESAAFGQIDRLRSQIQAMGRQQNGGNGQQGRNGQDQNGQNGQQGGQQPGNGGGSGQNGQQRNWASGSQQMGREGQQSSNGAGPGGNPGNRNGGVSGDTRNGGRGGEGTAWGNFDTGNNTPQARGQQQAVPTDASGNPADSERAFDQGVRELNQLRQMVHDDPQAAKDVQELTRKMQQLDPSRFPGNPAMVEQMHQEVLSSVDKLELQLQHDGASSQARTGKTDAIPAGYQESVAEYYRRLSKNP